MIKRMERIADLINELKELINEGVVSVCVDPFRKNEVFIYAETFFQSFSEYDVKERTSDEYPYGVETEIKDVRFFTILTTETYEKYVKGAKQIG